MLFAWYCEVAATTFFIPLIKVMNVNLWLHQPSMVLISGMFLPLVCQKPQNFSIFFVIAFMVVQLTPAKQLLYFVVFLSDSAAYTWSRSSGRTEMNILHHLTLHCHMAMHCCSSVPLSEHYRLIKKGGRGGIDVRIFVTVTCDWR